MCAGAFWALIAVVAMIVGGQEAYSRMQANTETYARMPDWEAKASPDALPRIYSGPQPTAFKIVEVRRSPTVLPKP